MKIIRKIIKCKEKSFHLLDSTVVTATTAFLLPVPGHVVELQKEILK